MFLTEKLTDTVFAIKSVCLTREEEEEEEEEEKEERHKTLRPGVSSSNQRHHQSKSHRCCERTMVFICVSKYCHLSVYEYLSFCLSVFLSVCLPRAVCLYVCLSVSVCYLTSQKLDLFFSCRNTPKKALSGEM